MKSDREKAIASRSLIQRVTRLFSKTEQPAPEITTERVSYAVEGAKLWDLSPARLSKYTDYEEMDDEIVELSSALDIYADFITSSPAGEQAVYNIDIEDKDRKHEAKIVEDLETRLNLKEKVWFITRNIVKYGDAFYEIVASPHRIVKFKYLPPKELFVNYKEDGKLNRKFPYIQKESMFGKEVAQFAPWEIAHFKVSDIDYGVDYSILAKVRRTYKVLRMLEDTLLVTRIVRANQRAVYKVDVTGMSEAEATTYIRKLKLMNKRKLYFSSTGKLKAELDPLSPQEDVYVPVRKGGIGGDYTVVGGERHLGQITDIKHFHNKLFAATKVPKAYLGFEKDVNAKATLIQQHIAFVKVVKRFRFTLSEGLRKFYRVGFLLRGVDPAAFNWKIKFPPIGSPDEEAVWRIEKLKADVIHTYGEMGVMLPIDWIVRRLMLNLSPEEAENLITQMKRTAITRMPSKDKDKEKGDKESDSLGSLGLSGNGDEVISDSELRDLMAKVENDPHIRRLAVEVEKAILAKREGTEYVSY